MDSVGNKLTTRCW